VGAGLLTDERSALFKAFGFTVLLQLAYPILLTFVSEEVARPTITLSEYFFSLRSLTLLMGFVFELQIIMWLVVRAGLVQYKSLPTSRRMAVLVMLVFAAIMTPPDVVTQVLVVIPMVLLYEVGLLLARKADKALASAMSGPRRGESCPAAACVRSLAGGRRRRTGRRAVARRGAGAGRAAPGSATSCWNPPWCKAGSAG
jgi:hypothetical protein